MSTHHNSDMTFAFHMAHGEGDLKKMERLMSLVDPDFVRLAAHKSIQQADFNAVKILAPYIHSECIGKMSDLLMSASVCKQQNIFDFLYPLCDRSEAIETMQQWKENSKKTIFMNEALHMLEERIKIDEEKDLMLSEVSNTDNIQRQKKM